MNHPIQRIAHVQTGSGDLHIQHVEGSAGHPLLWIFFGRSFINGLPMNVFIIEHQEGLVLVDAGTTPRVVTDPDYWPDSITRMFMNNLFRFHITPEDRLGTQLERAGYAADQVDKAILTHLHFDHVGGIEDIPGAELIVSKDAWAHMLGPKREREAVLRRDIEIPGAKWKQIDFAPLADPTLRPFTEGHDLMGDGSIVLLSTPGHLEGSISIYARTDPPILFVGDLCYRTELLLHDRMPGTGKHDVLAESWAKVRTLREHQPNLLILPSHDPGALEELRTHPKAQRTPNQARASGEA